MTPLMMAVIGISATLLPYFGDGPRWHEIVAKESDTCKANWWVNAIYLQNFINTPQMVSLLPPLHYKIFLAK